MLDINERREEDDGSSRSPVCRVLLKRLSSPAGGQLVVEPELPLHAVLQEKVKSLTGDSSLPW